MDALNLLETQWEYLLSMLSAKVDLEASARAKGEVLRRRVFRSAETLLHLVLAYCCGLSLRQTSCWAHLQGLGKLSQVGVMKCLRRSSAWLEFLVVTKLAERTECRQIQGLRLRLVDGTTVSAPGSQGTDWRVHLGFDLGSLTIDAVELTGAEGGESLSRFQVGAREVLIGDRGYGHRRGLWAGGAGGGGGKPEETFWCGRPGRPCRCRRSVGSPSICCGRRGHCRRGRWESLRSRPWRRAKCRQ